MTTTTVQLSQDDYERLHAVYDAAEAVLMEIGLPDCLGGPDLPPAVNRLIGATSRVRERRNDLPLTTLPF